MRLLQRLHDLQSIHGYLRDEDLRAAAEELRVPLHRIQELVSFYPHFRRTPPPRFEVALCRDLACRLAGGAELCDQARRRWQNGQVEVRAVSCLGRCDQAPAALLNEVPSPAQAVVEAEDLQTVPPLTAPALQRWRSDPYQALEERFGLLRELVQGDRSAAADRLIAGLKSAGLRGLGGAGFPTGTKWELVRKQDRAPKYVICNADESEPGTFKDREILCHLPHLVIEGMALAGLCVGAKEGILYIRHEYEAERLAFAAALAEAKPLLGDFTIEVFVSPGGYILGEETALLEALEDRRGEPRNKPPFPGTHGLYGQPTVINNVETLALVPAIVKNGADWWKAQGKPGFTGLKFMAVSGHVARPGVYEIPVGTTVRELIVLAGGMKDGKPLQAFLPGGASSNFLLADKADTPLDFAAMQQAGSMLGSGALVVVAEGADLLDLAVNVTRFFRNESCGKCVPCRVGTQQAVELLDRHLADRRQPLDVAYLQELNETLNQTSICGLGQVALGPLLSVIREAGGTPAPHRD